MNAVVNTLRAQVESLPPLDRVHLIEFLQESLDQGDKDVEAAWAEEAEDRLAALERGELALEDEPEVLRRLKARHP